MNLNKLYFVFVLLLFNLSRLHAVEAIDNTQEHLFFLDNSCIYKYELQNITFRKKITVFNDSALINVFFKTVGVKKKLSLSAIRNRFRSAVYFNVTAYENKIFVSAVLFSVDTSEKSWDYIIIEFSKDLQFRNFYLLQEPHNSRYGYAEPYPCFKLHFNKENEVMLTLSTHLPTSGLKETREPVFAIFKMDPKKNELRFNRLVYAPRPPKKMQTRVHYHYPKPTVYLPINIPLQISESPAYFSFPYVIVRNLNGLNTFDPFHHVQYSIDSSRQLDLNTSNLPVGYYMNTLNTRELILAYTYDNGKLKFILKNYAGKKDSVAVMGISGSEYSITPLNMAQGDLNNLYFHFIGDKILTVRKVKDKFQIQYAETAGGK